MFRTSRTGRALRCLLASAFLSAGFVQGAHAQTAPEILSTMDHVRNPRASFQMTNTLTEYRNGQANNSVVLNVLSKIDIATGQYRNLILYKQPSRDAGKALLMDEKIMWFYDPNSGAIIRISPQQRLLGQASNGDALSVNLSHDYEAKIAGEEKINDADRKTRDTWHLDLHAVSTGAVYERIEYWIEKQSYLPVMAVMYSDSGKPLKRIFYRKPEQQLGGLRPTEAIIIDMLDPALITKMSFSSYAAVDIPDFLYQKDSLPNLQAYEKRR